MKLSDYIRAEKLTLENFGALIGCTKMSVSRYLHGLRTPNAEKMRQIVRVTKGLVTPNDFYDMGETKTAPRKRRPAGKVRP